MKRTSTTSLAVRTLLVLVSIGLLPAAQVSACSCITLGGGSPDPPPPTPLYDMVFAGHVVSVEPIGIPLDRPDAFRPMYLVTFRATKVWKGPHRPIVWLVTGSGAGDCGFGFVEGGDYVVFADEMRPADRRELGFEKHTLTTDTCTPTTDAMAAPALADRLDRQVRPWEPRFRALAPPTPDP